MRSSHKTMLALLSLAALATPGLLATEASAKGACAELIARGMPCGKHPGGPGECAEANAYGNPCGKHTKGEGHHPEGVGYHGDGIGHHQKQGDRQPGGNPTAGGGRVISYTGNGGQQFNVLQCDLVNFKQKALNKPYVRCPNMTLEETKARYE